MTGTCRLPEKLDIWRRCCLRKWGLPRWTGSGISPAAKERTPMPWGEEDVGLPYRSEQEVEISIPRV